MPSTYKSKVRFLRKAHNPTWSALGRKRFEPIAKSQVQELVTRRGCDIDLERLRGLYEEIGSMALSELNFNKNESKIIKRMNAEGIILTESLEELANKDYLISILSRPRNDSEEVNRLAHKLTELKTEDEVKHHMVAFMLDRSKGANAMGELEEKALSKNITKPEPSYYECVTTDSLHAELAKSLFHTRESKALPTKALPTFLFQTFKLNQTRAGLEAAKSGAHGARALHELRIYINHGNDIYDDSAFVISTTFAMRDKMVLYTAWPYRFTQPETVGYKVCILKSYFLNQEALIPEALKALLNIQDWCHEQRQWFVRQANDEAARRNPRH